MYYFVPRLPTAQAYQARAFRDEPNLKGIVQQLKDAPRALHYSLRGQILLSDTDQPVQNLVKYQFSGIKGLELHLEKLLWDPARISSIYLYEHGAFKVCGQAGTKPKPAAQTSS